MNKQKIVEKMINEVNKIEKEEKIEKYQNDTAMKKDAVSKIIKRLKETTVNEN